MKFSLLLILSTILWQQLAIVSLAQTTKVTVVSIGDGDTLRVKADNKVITIRLACVDTPELGQPPYGTIAATRLKQLLPIGRSVDLRRVDIDKYGRTVGELYVAGKSINLQIVAEGQGVIDPRFINNCKATKSQYLADEANAKQKKLAFWNQSQPVMPWDFRRHRNVSHKPATSTQTDTSKCDSSYPDFCLTPGIADLDCSQIPYRNFRVTGSDRHRFDRDGDGIGCEGK